MAQGTRSKSRIPNMSETGEGSGGLSAAQLQEVDARVALIRAEFEGRFAALSADANSRSWNPRDISGDVEKALLPIIR
jgi:uncharacterized small protein (DUF1192 family)